MNFQEKLIPAAVTPVSLRDVCVSFFQEEAGARKFEDEVMSFFEMKKILTFSSLMRGSYVCFKFFSTDSRNEIVLPRYSCPSFAHGVLAAGMKIKHCDINPTTLSIDIESLKKTLTSKTAAVVCANLFGLSSKIDEIENICRERDILIVECVDYGIGTEYRNRKIGTFGDAVILNFQEGKALPVGGSAVLIRNANLKTNFHEKKYSKKKLKYILRMVGYSLFSRPSGYYFFRMVLSFLKLDQRIFSMEDTIRKTKGELDYVFNKNDEFFEISKFQKTLAGRLLDSLENNITLRFHNAELLRRVLFPCKNIQEIVPEPELTKIHYIRFPILVSANKRKNVLDSLYKNGIEASSMYDMLGMSISSDEFPGARQVMNEILTLPCHPFVREDDIHKMVKIIHEICGN